MPGADEITAGIEQQDEVPETQPLLSDQAQQPEQQLRDATAGRPADRSLQPKAQPASPVHAAPPPQPVAQLSKQNSGAGRTKSQELGQCRICLEEDVLTALEKPCGCTGTQRYAHKECIQKWVNEKHHTTCEICDQPYKGDYVVPPSPPPSPGEPLTLVSPMGNLYLTVEDERVAGQLLHDVYDDWDDHRQPTVSWCFSFLMLIMFMMILQSTMTVNVPDASGAAGGGSAAGGAVVPSPSPAIDPSSSAAAAAAGTAAGLLAGLSLFVVWLLSKLFLVVLPLLMVMRIAARAQEEAAEAAAAAATAGTVPGLDPAPGAGRGSAEAMQEHPLLTLIARVAAARAAAQAQEAGAAGASAAPGAAGAASSSADAVDVEMQQARREAHSRLGRDASFWAPAGASAAARPPGASSGSAVTVDNSGAAAGSAEQEAAQDTQSEVAAAQRLASLRALMRAIPRSCEAGEVFGLHAPRGDAPPAAAGSGDGAAGGLHSRHGMV